MAYQLFDFDERGWDDDVLPRLLDSAEQLGFAGLNITYPFKQAVIAHLDELSDAASRIGAVNTVAFADGMRVGHNTDVSGFARSVRESFEDVSGARVLQIGCGGGGSATAHALLGDLGVSQLMLFDSSPERAARLCEGLNAAYGDDRAVILENIEAAAKSADGIVNATPVGMDKFPGTPLNVELLDSRHWVAEIIYFPLETELLRKAQERGCRVLNGSGMAINQAADAFRIFTGCEPDTARMKKSFFDFAR